MSDIPNFDFDSQPSLEPAEIPVVYKKVHYVAREASEEAVIAYRATMSRGTTIEEGVVNMSDGISAADAVLVAYCLYKADSPAHLDVSVVRAWPHRIVKPIYEWIKLVSGIDEEDTPEKVDKAIARLQRKKDALAKKESASKNSQGSTGATSS